MIITVKLMLSESLFLNTPKISPKMSDNQTESSCGFLFGYKGATLHIGHLTAVCIVPDGKFSLGIFHSNKRTAPRNILMRARERSHRTPYKTFGLPLEDPTSANPKRGVLVQNP